jgi:hypothetical protein
MTMHGTIRRWNVLPPSCCLLVLWQQQQQQRGVVLVLWSSFSHYTRQRRKHASCKLLRRRHDSPCYIYDTKCVSFTSPSVNLQTEERGYSRNHLIVISSFFQPFGFSCVHVENLFETCLANAVVCQEKLFFVRFNAIKDTANADTCYLVFHEGHKSDMSA